MTDPIAGLFAAVPTPVDDLGRIDAAAFDRVVDLVVEAGVSGICIAGATGEYRTGPLPLPLTPQRQQQIAEVTAWLPEWLVSTGLGRVTKL